LDASPGAGRHPGCRMPHLGASRSALRI